MLRVLKKLWGYSWLLIAIVLIGSALLLGVLRLLLPFAGEYRAEVEQWVGEYLQTEVRIERFDLQWRGLEPSLKLVNIGLNSGQGAEDELHLAEAFLDLDLLRSLRHRQLQVRRITLEKLRLELLRDRSGKLTLAGLQQGESSAGQSGWRYLKWLQWVRRISLQQSQIDFRDALTGQSYRFDGVNIRISNEDEHHRLWAEISLPYRLGDLIEIGLDFEGPAHHPELWRGLVYTNLRQLRLQNWYEYWPQPQRPLELQHGLLDLVLWSRWESGRLQSLQGEVELGELLLRSKKGLSSYRLEQLASRINWQPGPERRSWQLDLQPLRFAHSPSPWPLGGLHLGFDRTDPTAPQWQLALDYLRLDDLMPLLLSLLPEESVNEASRPLLELLWGLKPRGELEQLRARYQPMAESDSALALQVQLVGVGTNPYRSYPGVEGVDGELRLGPKQLQLALQSRDLRLDYPTLFRQPLLIRQLNGTLQLQLRQNGWRLSSNELLASSDHLATRTRLALDFSPGKAPFLDLRSHFWDGDASFTSRYLPVGIMANSLVNWLDSAVQAGRVPSGNLTVYGDVAKFPFAQQEGVFDIEFDLEAGQLQYQPGWPTIEDLSAKLRFFGPSLQIDAFAGQIYASQLGPTEVRIDNLKQAELSVDGKLSGQLPQMLAFVRQSPLQSSVGSYLLDLEASGQANLDLKLDIPLKRVKQTRVKGRLQLLRNAISSKQLDLRVSRADGYLHFTEKGFSIRQIAARLRGELLLVKTQSLRQKGESLTRLSFESRQQIKVLSRHHGLGLEPFVDGAALWRLHLDLPRSGHASPMLRLESDLQGVSLKLPAPLGKSKSTLLPLRLESRIATGLGVRTLRFTLGKLLQGVLQLEHRQQAVKLLRGELRFNDGAAELPASQGVRIAGRLPSLPLESWLALLQQQSEVKPVESAKSDEPLLNGVDLQIERLQLFGHPLYPLRVQVNRQRGNWMLELQSDGVSGRVIVPYRLDSNQKLVINLAHLNLDLPLQVASLRQKGPEENELSLEPIQLPALQISVERLGWRGQELENCHLETRPERDGLSIRELSFRNDNLWLEAQGSWRSVAGQQRSELRFSLESEDLGQGLHDLGYAGIVAGGNGQLKGSLDWPAPPFRPDLAGLRGSLSLLFKDGRLVAVDPGVGRIFGLLSLQALPRRLSLDFKDFFREGFSFDIIRGSFQLSDGQAFTRDTLMRGPIGRIDVKGRTGLLAQDYDQVITVTPNVAGSLPLVGLLAGGAGTGLAVLAFEEILKAMGANVEELGQLKYTLRGSWENPQMQEVNQRPEKENDDLF